MRYRGAAGGAEKAHSRQRHWCLWSKPVNLGTLGTRARPHSDGTCLCRARTGMAQWYTLANWKTVSNVDTFPLRPFTLEY